MDSRDDRRLSALMQAAQAGDTAAYETVLRECVGVAAAVARRIGVRPATLDDAVQDVLLTIHRARHTYDPARPFLPWLHAIARRRAIDALRRHGRHGARELHDPDAYLNHAGPEDEPDLAIDRQDEAARLRVAIAGLPPSQRQAVELLGLQEQSLDEVTLQTGRSKVALKVNLHRALRALRNRFGGRDV